MNSKIAAGIRAAMTVVGTAFAMLGTAPASAQNYFTIGDLSSGQPVPALESLQAQIRALQSALGGQPFTISTLSLLVYHHNVDAQAVEGQGLGRALSCPVFQGDGTLLGEDNCAWTKVTGRSARLYGNTTDSAGLSAGGQREIASGWFVGGALNAERSWIPDGSGSTPGQAFDGSVALKHVMGPWLLAGSAALGTSATHTTRPAINGGTMQSDSNVFTGGIRLRAAYDIAFSGGYARPRVDLDGYFVSAPGYQEYGPDPAGWAVGGYQKVGTSIAPALEMGGRVDVGGALLRPYATAGATFLPNNTHTVDIGFTGLAAQLGTLRMAIDGPSVLGIFEAGLQFYRAHAWEMKTEYGLQVGDSYLSQSLSLRGAYHF